MNRSELIDQLMEHFLAEQLEAEAKAGAFGPAPNALLLAQGKQKASLWQTIAGTVWELTTAITIRVGKGAATFDALPALLQPQLVPVPIQRARAIGDVSDLTQKIDELLELPHPEANLLIRVNMASVVDGKGALVLEVQQLTPPQPIPEAKVTLRDHEDDLLERTSTDQDGLATFADLATGKYAIVVEQGGQRWRFGLTLSAQDEDAV